MLTPATHTLSHRYVLWLVVPCLGLLLANPPRQSLAALWPPTPVFSATFADCVTGDNDFVANDQLRYWTIDPECDSYQNEFYERPTVQNYQVRTLAGGEQRFATQEYYGNLDIVLAKAGFDEQYLYFAIEIFSRDRQTSDGVNTAERLDYEYDIRMSTDPDGRNGLLLRAVQPESKHGTVFGLESNKISQDTDADVGGRGIYNGGPTGISVTKSDNLGEEQGAGGNLNGYDVDVVDDGVIKDGALKDNAVLYSRIDPNDDHIVEFAFAYRDFGLSADFPLLIQYLDFQTIKGDPEDPRNYFWNDKYTQSEAGSPYRATSGDLTKSEFGTQGLGNIYELDTLRGVGFQEQAELPPEAEVIPEPGSIVTWLLGCAGLGLILRRRMSKTAA